MLRSMRTGKVLTDAAIAHIKTKLGGKANVVLLTQDTMEFLAPRFEAMRDGLNALPGVTIVADIAPKPVTKEGGFATMNTILVANPNIDVVLGGDAVVLGALKALRAAGKDRPDQFLGGIDGEPEAVAEIKKGDSPYESQYLAVLAGVRLCDGAVWSRLAEGKSIPQAMDILPMALTNDNHRQYEADLKNPAVGLCRPHRGETPISRCTGTSASIRRDRYVNFPWSSEQK